MRTALALAVALTAAALPAPAVRAEGAGLPGIMTAEMLPGWRTPQGSHMTAVRITLAQGWKTYWRAPGDAGVPPQFGWAGSENLRATQFHWPRPTVFDFAGMQTVGYVGELVLPIELWPDDPDQPIRMAAQMELGVCRDICIPTSVMLRADLPPAARHDDPAIRKALAARPQTGREAGLTAHRCRAEPLADGLRLTAELDLPSPDAEETVVIEPGDPVVWASAAETSRNGGRLTAVVDLIGPGRAPFALDRSALTITVLSKGRAVQIDGCPGG